MLRRLTIPLVLAQLLCAAAAMGDITSASLEIQGAGLRVETVSVTTGVDIPSTIQTSFGGRTNDDSPAVPGLLAVGDLSGPGIEVPIQLTTTPGYRFHIPGLPRLGDYYLQNIRLMNGNEVVQPATPSLAKITVADLLQTSLKVKQLTPEQIRERGIIVDARNYDVYEYTFSFLVNGETVEVPFPVIIDPRTHVVTPVKEEKDYGLPPAQKNVQPPRWTPPDVIPFEFPDLSGEGLPDPGTEPRERAVRPSRPRIPAALVIPNSLAVLHQFFAVMLTVTNGAPTGSTARLEDIDATLKIKVPTALRAVKSTPSVAFGQAVPVVDPNTGVTVLLAQGKGEAEWTLEGLKPGTHTVEVDIRATLREQGQDDVHLRATPSASVIIHDPRFNITFSHPDTVRKGIDYSTFAFITNMSPQTQTIRVSDALPQCSADLTPNVCRVAGGPPPTDMTIPAGEMKVVEYRLRPGETGQVFATAGTVDGEAITAAVQLHMGVSPSGIPLSPATLVLPYYAQFLSSDLVGDYLELLGLGYSLATAPVNQTTARFPRVIKTDVFYRANDIARAGQRVFIGNTSADAKRDALNNMLLDLLGNSIELREWDELRRTEGSGRRAGAAVMTELRAALIASQTSMSGALDEFASDTSHRDPYVAALAHGPAGATRPVSIALRGVSGRTAAIANEEAGGWTRDLAFADVSRFDAFDRMGELAVAGRWTEDLELVITSATGGLVHVELLFPGTTDGTAMRAHIEVTTTANVPLRVPLTRGQTNLNVLMPNGGFAMSATASPFATAALTILGARQDLHLDDEGHKVSLLFSRPVGVAEGTDLVTKFAGAIDFNKDGIDFDDVRPIFAAALQGDGRVVNLSFDHVLSTNASYTVTVSPFIDPASGASVPFPQPVVPKIDMDRPAGILYGKFLTGNNTPIPGAEIKFFTGHFVGCVGEGRTQVELGIACNPFAEAPQYARTRSDGSFLFEYVPRDPIADPGLTGAYKAVGVTADGKATAAEGSVRLPGRVHIVNLQLLGRGSAEGTVKYDNGQIASGVRVHVSSTMFNVGRDAVTDANGFFRVDDLAVGPITFGAQDDDGNVTFASGEIATPGQVVVKELVIYRKPFPGTGTVYGKVTRSDTGAPVFGARVGVYSQGYGFAESTTDSDGRFEFTKVPSGFVTLLASEWSISRENAAADFDLKTDETKEMNLSLSVTPNDMPLVRVTGRVLRENPLFPGDPTKYEPVPGAVVNLAILTTTANDSGVFTFDGVPIIAGDQGSAKTIRAYDPSTKRIGSITVPTLFEDQPNEVTVFIPANSYGGGTIRVRVVSAAGVPVDGFRVIEPGYPPLTLTRTGAGLYEYRNAPIGHLVEIYAVDGPAAYGEQVGKGTIRLDFPGQTATLILRLPGQGTVRAKLRSDFDLIGDVALTFSVWDENEQGMMPFTVSRSTSENGVAGFATFTAVPGLQNYTVASGHPVYGYADQSGQLAYDGDVTIHTLQLNRLSTVRGTVYAIDGVTPIANAAVRLTDGRRDAGIVYTQPDGTFIFHDVPAAVSFSVRADVTQSGIYRTGIAYGRTPDIGGPAPEIPIILRRRGSVEGKVVYADYKVYDAENPANRVADDTPNDYSDNAPVPLAKLWLRELDFPERSFGSGAEPLTADVGGRFAVSNVFTGSLRAMGWSAENPDLRGNWTGVLSDEGQTLTGVYIAIGGGGTGSLQVKVVDPNQQYLPIANAEVRLYRGGLFDLATTDDAGLVRFDQLPVGNYGADAYSKSLGKSGAGTGFTISRDQLTEIRIDLEFVGKVDGRLTDPMVNPPAELPGRNVKLTASSFYALSTTDTHGLFFFEGIREGSFTLEAKDTESNRWARAQGSVTPANRRPFVEMELERTDSLHVAVYLPNDTGGNSGTLAGPFEMDVVQRCGPSGCDYHRTLQGNPLVFPSLFVTGRYGGSEQYFVTLDEIGGAGRRLTAGGSFPKGTSADPVKVVYPAFGGLEITVMQSGSTVQGARVEMSQGGERRTVYTNAAGKAAASGFVLGNVTVQAKSIDGDFTGSANVTIERQSVIATETITLGAYAGVSGFVEAEAGGPSIGTRVVATFAGRTLEMLTDGEGGYLFQGIPTTAGGTPVSLSYVGPDGVTVGARQTTSLTTVWSSKVRLLSPVKLDATPPQLLTVTPADGAQNVSPDAPVTFVFSEQLDASGLVAGNLQLIAADGSGQVAATITSSLQPDKTFIVTLRPTLQAGERFALKSNTLYRIVVQAALSDLTGHRLPAPRGSTFTTSDYAEPRVVRLVPPVNQPLPAQVTLQFHFNEPVDPATPVFHFYKLSAAGAGGSVVAEKPGRAYVDPASGLYLAFAPDQEIEPESYYRAVFSGVRDLQGNQLPEQTYHYFSFDSRKPYLRLISPVPDGTSLVSGVQYTLNIDARSDSLDGPVATDVASVEYVKVDGATETFLTTVTAAPFAYRFSAPEAPEAGIGYTVRAKATDMSGNAGPPSTISWTVKPNAAPKNVALTLTPPSAYPGATVTANVTFEDEGILAPIQVVARGPKTDGTEYVQSAGTEARRNTVAEPWPPVALQFQLPVTLTSGSTAAFTATVTDVRGLSASANASLSILADTIKPTIVSTTPAAEKTYTLNAKYNVAAVVSDAETGVSEVQFVVDGTLHRVFAASSTTGPVAGSRTFTSPQITATARNVDTRIPIVVRAIDYHGNVTTKSFDVIYIGVNDPTAPRATWLCPIDRAVIPASQTAYKLNLKVRAQDDVSVTAVKFRVPGLADPVTASRIGATDEYEVLATFDTPVAGTAFTLAAIVSDADETHTIELPIAIDVVAFDRTIDATEAVDADTVQNYEGKSLMVRGPGKLVINVPLAVPNLAAIDGGRIETLGTTTGRERKLDLTVTDRLYIDCTSTADVTAKGYLGGWGVNPDGTGTRSDSAAGRTLGNLTTGGAANAAGSHGGIGGALAGGASNAVYGSITDPFELGSGGAGHPTATNDAGGTGGGAISLRTSNAVDAVARIVVAGSIRADGGSGRHGGSGGSIRLNARQIIAGPLAQLSANGARGENGCGNGTEQCLGGSGGRIALTAEERLELATPFGQVRAFGGAVGSGGSMLGGAAGTIYVRRPGQTQGELYIAQSDSAAAVSYTRSTPLGNVAFDRMILGPWALVRMDGTYAIAGVADDPTKIEKDPTAIVVARDAIPTIAAVTTPANGAQLIRNTPLELLLDLTAPGGAVSAQSDFSAAPPVRVSPFSYQQSIDDHRVTWTVPSDAPLGPATLKIKVTDRADRTFETTVATFTVIDNLAPAIDSFTALPASIYPGGTVTATLSAHDDVSVTRISATAQIGASAPSAQSRTPNAKSVTNETFTFAIPVDTPGGTPMTVDAGVEDAFPGRVATKQTANITILHDTVGPQVAVNSPSESQLFEEAAQTFSINVTATDAEVKVKTVTARVGEGTTVPLSGNAAATTWTGTLGIPPVDGEDIVPFAVTVTATDYAGNATVYTRTIRVRPTNDPNAPSVAWKCGRVTRVAAGVPVKLRVEAIAANALNPVQKVEFFIDSNPPITATSIGSNLYEATWNVPAGAATYSVRAAGTSSGGAERSFTHTVTAVVADQIFNGNASIAAADTSYDNKVIAVTGGTLTIAGAHPFADLFILGGSVTHAAADTTVRITTGTLFVACDASIDVTSRGYAFGASHPASTASGSSAGGSHIGLGAMSEGGNEPGATYGSIYQPLELGGGANGSIGGGLVAVTAQSVQLDGAVRANGGNTNNAGSGAGGSVWIRTAKIAGTGSIEANGGSTTDCCGGRFGGGGGGAIAIEYTDATSVVPVLRARAVSAPRLGAAGTIYVKGPSSTYGSLTIDNAGFSGALTTLPSLGNGVAQAGTSGTTLVTDRAADIPAYFAGHYVEIEGKGRYRVTGVSAKTVTLEAGANAAPGDKWQGVYVVDAVTVANNARLSSIDPIRTTTFEAAGNGLEFPNGIDGVTVTIRGTASTPRVNAIDLIVETGGVLTGLGTSGLAIDVTNLTVRGTIDVSGQGFGGNATYSGATASGNATGGAHMGLGGFWEAPVPTTFGSVYRPREPGGGGGNGTSGGGVVKIDAGAVTVIGAIRANGTSTNNRASGAGGSIWIQTGRISGTGTIEANGGSTTDCCGGRYGGGGGGAVSIEYTDPASALPVLRAMASTAPNVGGAGTVYVKGASSAYGTLTIDNANKNGTATSLPSLGSGIAQAGTSGTTLVTDRAANIPAYFAGHWVEIEGKGTWRITAVDAKTATLETGANVAPGDKWQGVYRFDNLNLNTTNTFTSIDPIRLPAGAVVTLNGTTTAGQYLTFTEPLVYESIVINGNVSVASVTADNLTVAAGALLVPYNGSTITLDVKNLTVAAGGTIDVTGRGYPANGTYSGATAPGSGSGAAHIGTGGLHNSPAATTFGSIYRPSEPGGGGNGSAGGGVVKIASEAITVNGFIRANGANTNNAGSGAGGSIWIQTGRISGNGTIEANGGSTTDCCGGRFGGGGGGAVAVEYTDATSSLPTLRAMASTAPNVGGAGTVYVKGASSTYGTLTIDNANKNGTATILPSLGNGIAQAGSSGTTLVTDRAANIPAYFAGHWVEIEGKGTWRITAVDAKTATLETGANVAAGDTWRGVYRFDDFHLEGMNTFTSLDPIRLPAGTNMTLDGPTGSLYLMLTEPLVTERVTVKGNVAVANIEADELTVAAGAVLTAYNNSTITLDVKNLTVAAGGTIDVTSRGFGAGATYAGATVPGNGSGGAHMGIGGVRNAPAGTTFGSLHQPNELGGGGSGSAGGGVVTIVSESITVDGVIRANSSNTANNGSGAGGSILIRTAKIAGAGTIEASSGTVGDCCGQGSGSGGGGAVAVHYTDATSVLPTLRAIGGNAPRIGAAGTIYVKGASSTFGELTVDNANRSSEAPTVLPSLGSGIAQAGSAGTILVTDRTTDIPAYFIGHWIEIEGKGTWRITAVSAKTATLETGANVAPGDKWQGVYRFDNLFLKGMNTFTSLDPVRLPAGANMTLDGPTGSLYLMLTEPLVTERVTVKGNVAVANIKADELTVAAGAVLTAYNNSTITLDVKNLTVAAGGTIDVTSRGFGAGATYSGATVPGNGSGGAHMGVGGVRTAPAGTTFGSLYQPNELGGGGSGSAGGGVVTIVSESITVDGVIRANSSNTANNGSGAGGSILIRTAKISGAGTIEASSGTVGDCCGQGSGSGGGGAVAVHYTDATSVLPTLRAIGGNAPRIGGAGTIYVKGPSSTFGELTVDNANRSSEAPTVLPSLGNGIAQAGSTGTTLITDRATDIPAYFVGHWIEIEGKGSWRITAVNAKTATLETGANVAPGDKWQGVYRFDNLFLKGMNTFTSLDPVRLPAGANMTLDGPTGSLYLMLTEPLVTDRVTVKGNVAVANIEANELTVAAGAVLTAHNNSTITLDVKNLTVAATGSIDVTSRGFSAGATYAGAIVPGNGSGGAHIGVGGVRTAPAGTTFGSIREPNEMGGGGSGSAGGGVVTITSDTVTVDGAIRANSSNASNNGSGAGGSILIRTAKISGSGTIEASSGTVGDCCGQGSGSGGGGAVAVHYTDATSVLPTLRAIGGNAPRIGGAGTIYVKAPSSTHGDLTVDNAGRTGNVTDLPSLGLGTAQPGSSGTTLVTDRAANIPPYFIGHWVEIEGKGLWRITAVNLKTATLEAGANVAAGDTWRGVYRVDTLELRTSTLQSGDPIRYTTLDKDAASTVISNSGPPQFPPELRSQIVVSGDSVAGPAGAVTDSDTPIKVTVTNVRTAQTFTANAAANGSFSVPVAAIAGDTFTVRATDSHALPMTSITIPVNGSFVETNSIASFTIDPATVPAGTAAIASIRLALPARLGGITVSLGKTNPAAIVPATFTIPVGSTTAQFAINTTAVATHTSGAITATLSNAKSAMLTVAPTTASITSLVLSAPTTVGGTSVDATITLGAAAPPGGALVMISADSPLVQLPSSVSVAEGLTQTTFSVGTSRVASSTVTNISATYGKTETKPLTLDVCAAMPSATPPASIVLAATWVDDAAPAGAVVTGDATFDNTQVASGTLALHFGENAATRSWSFTGASPLAVAATDNLVLYALVNPCKPPRQILVSFGDGTTEWRASWGESRIAPLATNVIGAVPAGGVWTRLEVPAKSLGISAASLTRLTVSVDRGELWLDAVGKSACALPKQPAPQFLANETVWFDDALPAGAVAVKPFNPDTSQVASGSSSDLITGPAGRVEHYFHNATDRMTLSSDDMIVVYALIDPCAPPRQIMLQFNYGTEWNRNVYWGESTIDTGYHHFTTQTPTGVEYSSVTYRRMGPMPEAGKWVRLEIPVSGMQMAGTSVHGMSFNAVDGRAWFDRVAKVSRVNLALGKTASQSSTYQNDPQYAASKIVDGDVINLNHTNSQAEAYVEVDLGAVQAIDTIDVWNFGDCCMDRLQQFYVLVSDEPIPASLTTARNKSGVSAYYHQHNGWRPSTFEIGRKGRYVRVQLAGTNYLHVSELQVWAPVSPMAVNYASGTQTSQSSTHSNEFSGKAVNGSSMGFTWSHTASEAGAWWQADLGSIQWISTIDLDNTIPGTVGSRMADFYLYVSDQPFASGVVADTLAQTGVSAYYRGPWKTAHTFAVNRTGRFVRLQLTGTNYLHPTEVKVFSPLLSLPALAKGPSIE